MTNDHGAGSRARLVGWMAEGTRLFEEAVDGLDDDALFAPSPLEGWTRAHVVTHVARNADAIGNLLAWAATGVETPMYPSAEARVAGIAAGAQRPAGEIRRDLAASSRRLQGRIDELPDRSWAAEVRTAQGRLITTEEVPWMRIREVWIHLVDLDAGRDFTDVPPDILAALLDDATAWMGTRDGTPAVTLRAIDGDARWSIAGSGEPTEVRGSLADLAAWVLGRGIGQTLRSTIGDLPTLPRWL
jgi:maleylpyruvate isomerase